jgi:hypothetical protein
MTALDAYVAAVVADDPIAFWPAQEASGVLADAIAAFDITPTAGEFLYAQAPSPAYDASVLSMKFRDDVLFNGRLQNTSVDVGAVDGFAYEWWFRAAQNLDGLNLFRAETPFTTADCSGNSRPRFVYQGVAILGTATAAGSLDTNEWHHIVFTRGEGATENLLYIDGVLDSTWSQATGTDGGAGVTWGHASLPAIGWWTCGAVYDDALSAEQVEAHFLAMTEEPVIPPSGGGPGVGISLGLQPPM